MLKKTIIATVLAFSGSMAFANGTPYVGAGFGVENASGYNGLMGNIFTGYGVKLGQTQRFYLGGELFADVGSIPLSRNQTQRTSYGLGASVIPGIMINQDSMVYARLGVETSRFTKSKNYSTGGQAGVGLQTHLTQNWDVRGEYDYTGWGVVHNLGVTKNNRLNLGFLYNFA